MNYSRAQMKQEVKKIMRETRPRPIWLTLLYLVIVAAGGWVIQSVLGGIMGVNSLATLYSSTYMDVLMNGGDMERAMEQMVTYLLQNVSVISGIITGSILISILNYLWQSLMSVSYVGYSLAMVRRENPSVKTLFSAFPKFGKVILTRILVGVFTFLWTLLFAVAFIVVIFIAALLTEGAVFLGVLLMIVGYVAFFAALLWVALRYAMTDYLLMDHGLSGLEAIRVSKQLMKGNKRRLFVLQLSFIGWYLLEMAIIYAGVILMVLCALPMADGSMGGIVVGVVLILVMLVVMVVAVMLLSMWLTPYISGATARFYEYTMSRRPDLFSRRSDTYTDDSFGSPNYPKLD